MGCRVSTSADEEKALGLQLIRPAIFERGGLLEPLFIPVLIFLQREHRIRGAGNANPTFEHCRFGLSACIVSCILYLVYCTVYMTHVCSKHSTSTWGPSGNQAHLPGSFKNNCLAEVWSGFGEGSYLRLIECCVTQL